MGNWQLRLIFNKIATAVLTVDCVHMFHLDYPRLILQACHKYGTQP